MIILGFSSEFIYSLSWLILLFWTPILNPSVLASYMTTIIPNVALARLVHWVSSNFYCVEKMISFQRIKNIIWSLETKTHLSLIISCGDNIYRFGIKMNSKTKTWNPFTPHNTSSTSSSLDTFTWYSSQVIDSLF